jgi:hypothetical protein
MSELENTWKRMKVSSLFSFHDVFGMANIGRNSGDENAGL